MNSMEQMKFVCDHTDAIGQECVRLISEGKVPEEFDGHELRVWLSDKFKDSARMSTLRQHPHSKRNKDFRNWKAITPGA